MDGHTHTGPTGPAGPEGLTPSPELNPLSLSEIHGDDAEQLAPLPVYKEAGETVLDFGGLLQPPTPALRLREDLTEGCGGQTWPAGMVLAKHLLRHRRAEMARASILELGAGGGLVGLAVALARSWETKTSTPPAAPVAPILLTDQAPMLALLQHNIALNGLQDAADACVLNWGDPLPAAVEALRPTVVLAADCIYFEPAFPLLLTTLTALLALGDAARPVTVYFCFKKRRRADWQFVKQARKRFVVVDLADDDRALFNREGLYLYAMTQKRAEGTR